MLKISGLILQLSEGRGLRVVVGVFICVKNISASTELWVDDDFEMTAVEVKGKDDKYTWEFIDIYSVPNDDILANESSVYRTLPRRN